MDALTFRQVLHFLLVAPLVFFGGKTAYNSFPAYKPGRLLDSFSTSSSFSGFSILDSGNPSPNVALADVFGYPQTTLICLSGLDTNKYRVTPNQNYWIRTADGSVQRGENEGITSLISYVQSGEMETETVGMGDILTGIFFLAAALFVIYKQLKAIWRLLQTKCPMIDCTPLDPALSLTPVEPATASLIPEATLKNKLERFKDDNLKLKTQLKRAELNTLAIHDKLAATEEDVESSKATIEVFTKQLDMMVRLRKELGLVEKEKTESMELVWKQVERVVKLKEENKSLRAMLDKMLRVVEKRMEVEGDEEEHERELEEDDMAEEEEKEEEEKEEKGQDIEEKEDAASRFVLLQRADSIAGVTVELSRQHQLESAPAVTETLLTLEEAEGEKEKDDSSAWKDDQRTHVLASMRRRRLLRKRSLQSWY